MATKKAKKKATKKKATKKTTKKVAKKPAKKVAKKKVAKKATKKPAKKATKKPAKKVAKKATKKVAKKAPSPSTEGTRTVVQHVYIPASPDVVFRMLTDPTEHGALVGGVCTGEPHDGNAFSAFDGYITGTYEEVVAPRLVRATWQTTEWPKRTAASRIEFTLEDGEDGGTELTLTHSELPASQAEQYRQGWIDYYWNPLIQAVRG